MKKPGRDCAGRLGLMPGDLISVTKGGLGYQAVFAGIRGKRYELDLPVQSTPGSRPCYLRKEVLPEDLDSLRVIKRGFEPHRLELPMVEVCSPGERYLGYVTGRKDDLLLVSAPGERETRLADTSDLDTYVYPVGRKGPFLEPE